jgi:predicted MFS family arabinose efflux permease
MTAGTASTCDIIVDRTPAWGAVLAMSLCCMVLVASEFMPVSLLTPIAADLHMTEGQAGQAISVSGIFAVLTSLSISGLTSRWDRRNVLLVLALSLIVSGTVVALAPNYTILMLGRAVLGIAIGGFWSMSAAAVMRLVPEESVPRALAILQGGTALSSIVAAPLGSFLGGYIGWRGAFFCVVPLAAIALVWLLAKLPSMHAGRPTGSGNVFRLLRRPVVASGIVAITLFFMGQFALFTYLRPFLEMVTHVDVPTLSLILLFLGITGLAGTTLIGTFLKNGMYGVMIAIPFAMAGIAIALIAFGNWLAGTAVLLGAWGLLGTPAPVAWNTWLVAAIQLAITLGATVGGLLFDMSGYQSTFGASAAILAVAGLMAFVTKRIGSSERT